MGRRGQSSPAHLRVGGILASFSHITPSAAGMSVVQPLTRCNYRLAYAEPWRLVSLFIKLNCD